MAYQWWLENHTFVYWLRASLYEFRLKKLIFSPTLNKLDSIKRYLKAWSPKKDIQSSNYLCLYLSSSSDMNLEEDSFVRTDIRKADTLRMSWYMKKSRDSSKDNFSKFLVNRTDPNNANVFQEGLSNYLKCTKNMEVHFFISHFGHFSECLGDYSRKKASGSS